MSVIEEMSDWKLADAEALSDESPDRFSIPSAQARSTLQPGDYAKLVFRLAVQSKANNSLQGERMWVVVKKVSDTGYEGILDNDPEIIKSLSAGDRISFQAKNVIDISK